MILQIADWTFDIDISQTMQRSGLHAFEHCLCGYCRNFYATVDNAYPNIRPFLSQFGVNIEGPDEFCPYEPTICEATYVVLGSILQKGRTELFIDNIPVWIVLHPDLDHAPPQPSFGITIGLMELPWVLNEPMEEVISPANEPECLDRMWKKLIARSNRTPES